jgi:hypothetical protein
VFFSVLFPRIYVTILIVACCSYPAERPVSVVSKMSGQQEDGTSECGQESIEDEVYDACRTRCPCF